MTDQREKNLAEKEEQARVQFERSDAHLRSLAYPVQSKPLSAIEFAGGSPAEFDKAVRECGAADEEWKRTVRELFEYRRRERT